jgi:hypothetical protein
MLRSTTTLLLLALLAGSAVHAEEPAAPPPSPGIRASVANVRFDHLAASQPGLFQSTRRNGTAQKVGAGFAMGFLGMLAGGWIGGHIDRNCRCDDPGLQGSLIGAPIGAALGATLGVWLASK